MIGSWYHCTEPVPGAVRVPAEGYFDPCIRDHGFPRRGPRPVVVAELRYLLGCVAAMSVREIMRDPAGVLDQPRSPFWADWTEAA